MAYEDKCCEEEGRGGMWQDDELGNVADGSRMKLETKMVGKVMRQKNNGGDGGRR